MFGFNIKFIVIINLLIYYKWFLRVYGIKVRNILLYIYNVFFILYWNKIDEFLIVVILYGC